MKKATIRKTLLNLTVLVIFTMIALLIAEGIVRLLFKDQMALFPRYNTDVQYGSFSIRRVRPNMEYTHQSIDGRFNFISNNRGFRSHRDIDYLKQNDELRILCLGDSHTLGYEVNQDQTFSAVAETVLNNSQIKATVINAGVSGFSTAEALIFLENEGYKYDPDFVVLGLYANDFVDNTKTRIFDIKNDSLMVVNHVYLPGIKIQNFIYSFRIFHFLGEHSYLYAYAFNTVWKLYKDRRRTETTEYAVAMNDDYSKYEMDLMNKIIHRMYNFCHQRGIPLIIIDIPRANLNSSIPSDLVEDVASNCDTLFYFQNMKKEYMKLSKTHVPHGSRHISAETHDLLANKIAEYVGGHLKPVITHNR